MVRAFLRPRRPLVAFEIHEGFLERGDGFGRIVPAPPAGEVEHLEGGMDGLAEMQGH